jgi:hypothetical protein
MTSVPEALAPERERPEPLTARERVSTDVPGDVAKRLRIWAALRGLPAAHIVAALICQAVPDAEQLADLMRTGGGRDHDER